MATTRRQPAAKAGKATKTRADGTRKPGVRELAAQATREAILRAATKVFAKSGFDGGRIEAISKAAKSYDRMIYYYFGSKEGLFVAVLEDTYRRFNEAEQALDLDVTQPQRALEQVIRFVWRYYQQHPEFITLLNTENLHRGRHLAKSAKAREYSSPVIDITDRVLQSGVGQGVFRSGLAARDVYLTIAAMAYFYLSNRHTLSAFLGENLEAPAALVHWEAHVVDTVQRSVAA
ncbi:TetR family transcriptional regulator [Aquabacterium sp. OR-4]|uniref:TetR family transcriptional regulator n=1 Tax=Aquabacterium sp. OR-4 TaxID=2978127 RepID=UPI0021B2AFD7|nr:TetR family transcriptional regulator [Aquabacterium sp. OR-4]MDT7836229.1 TetR family transcriptional regulator [Aquabacterium sp. OR-4]